MSFAILVDAINLCGPRIVGDIVAGSLRVELSVVGQLEHDGSHHFVVLVEQDVAVVNEARVLSQLVNWNVERSVSNIFSVARFGPSHPVHEHLAAIN